MTILTLLLAASLFVAYVNGANDNFKGVATLYGSGTTGYWSALGWATLTTLAGSLSSVYLSDKLVKAFSAKGLVPADIAAAPEFLTAVALGAALTIFLATMTGFPISTTHALTGGLVGAGIAAAGGSVNFSLLGKNFFLPLVASPLLAMLLAGAGFPFFRWALRCTGLNSGWCACDGARDTHVETTPGITTHCLLHSHTHFIGVKVPSLLDIGHFFSAGATSFARGLNDTPKIVGLMFVFKALHVQADLVLVAAVMAIGGLFHARKVAETVSRRITPMNHSEGFAANLITSFLVLTASHSGFPVSTTHVSCGSLFGIGLKTRQADSSVIRHVVMSWVLTLPIAALLAAGISRVL